MSWFSAWCGLDFRVYGVGAHVGLHDVVFIFREQVRL